MKTIENLHLLTNRVASRVNWYWEARGYEIIKGRYANTNATEDISAKLGAKHYESVHEYMRQLWPKWLYQTVNWIW